MVQIDGGEFIEDKAGLLFTLLVDCFDQTGYVKGNHSAISHNLARIITHTNYFGVRRIIDIQGKVVSGEHIIKRR
ncbi:hypothetical protein D3C86_1945060 [compost metagenome]